MMTVCGNPQARSGTITYDGRDITRLSTHLIMRQRIAQAPEGRRIFGRMTVRENLVMGAEVALCFGLLLWVSLLFAANALGVSGLEGMDLIELFGHCSLGMV
jgi:ABC-type branched-subunit amino acid transport system ATPase component